MNCLRHIVPLIVLLNPHAFPLQAQSPDEAFFRREAAEASILYRGHRAYTYSIRHNGSFWWSAAGFASGDVCYNGRIYHGLLLNVDAVRQELVLKNEEFTGGDGKVLAREFVSWFTMDGSRFLNLGLEHPEALPGYWELLYDGRVKFFRQVTKVLSPDNTGTKRPLIGEGEPYDSNVHSTFVREVAYCCLTDDGRIVPIRTKRQILNLCKEYKQEIRRHIAALETRLNTSLALEEYGREVFRFVETL